MTPAQFQVQIGEPVLFTKDAAYGEDYTQ